MRKIELKDRAGYDRYNAKFAERTPNPLALEFLEQVRVIGFEQNGELIGGYIVNDRAPYRYSAKIPESHRDTPHTRTYLSDGAAVELACMWLDHGAMTPLRRTRIYLSAMADAMRSKPKWILAGSVTIGVAHIHKMGFKHMIYAGPTTFAGEPYGEIYAATRFDLVRYFPGVFVRDLARRMRKRARRRSKPKRNAAQA
ncbi:MAG: hypothetical protein AAF401_18290 [Pseudomonadota bacterium]